MSGRALLEIHFSILLALLSLKLYAITLSDAGAPTYLKNPVNLYTHSPIDNSNLSNPNQFQNEYQYRQSASKTASAERYKSSPLGNTETALDQSSGDLAISGQDYSYPDIRTSTNVPDCKGRLRLNGSRGYITDGPGVYQTNLQCIWLIDSGRENATIRIQVHQFNTECNYDFLYIFDGDSIYSPLVAALSGDMVDFSSIFDARQGNLIFSDGNRTNSKNASTSYHSNQNRNMIIPSISTESHPFELKTNSGRAFIYFHSDTAQSMPGFYLTYSIDSCPLDCSNRGECDYASFNCKCNPGYYGAGCQFLLCPNNCTSPEHGQCDTERSCICNNGFQGTDCSTRIDHQAWVHLANQSNIITPRAFHQSIAVDGIMWVIGGKTQPLSNTNNNIFKQKKTSMVHSFNIESRSWSDVILEGTTGIDHLAEVSGHSVAAKGHKVFIFGGTAMNNTVMDALTVLDTKTNLLTSLPNSKRSKSDDEFSAPIAVTGHTSNIIDSHMYVFLGYSPLYGYLNMVQKFNLANNTWSIVERKGSSIEGCIGHTSTFDSISHLVFVYGGHHSHRLNTLHSFDPHTEIWTLLQSGPTPRYYHNSVIINRQLIILGGNSYNTSYQSDQCYQQVVLTYDLSCATQAPTDTDQANLTSQNYYCGRECWHTIEDPKPGVLKRHGHSVASHNKEIILYGGFNGILLDDIRIMDVGNCEALQEEDCIKPKLAINCHWNAIDSKCEDEPSRSRTAINSEYSSPNCSKNELKALQHACEHRTTCTDCLNTNIGCVWCGLISIHQTHCQFSKCKSPNNKAVLDPNLCFREEIARSPSLGMGSASDLAKPFPVNQALDNEWECRRLDNCYLCHSRPQCSWQSDFCTYSAPNVIQSPTSSLTPAPQDDINDIYGNNAMVVTKPSTFSNSSRFMQRFDPNKSFLAAFTTSLLNSSPYHSCDVPCYKRPSCNECTTTKCIWCSTTEQCIDSSAYFAYHAMGQCMHYVAHMLKCPVASCADIESCDKCLTNPKCGWLNDISNTGKGRCVEGTLNGPSFTSSVIAVNESTNSSSPALVLPNWYYTSCPLCQCNGHSYCNPRNSICIQSCQDSTEGAHCDKCIAGYFGDPTNGGTCRPCRCNGHAQSCNRETGKCYCSTKGIIGHTCNKCDDQNHYLGDPSSPGNGTCYYNLTTDYQYTFNMSKPEDHFYSDINFINVPLRKDSDVDFTIACSRLALVNITSGTSYKNRKPIHTGLECNSFRLRFPHERHGLTETNHSFFVHVYKFQTPFILQIAFSQHRTLYLPQFFFTFSSCFLFFFALSGLVWKLKHEYDLYVRRQRQFIEMEQMASRPFSTILLEIFKPSNDKSADQALKTTTEPTPISFEPCFGSNVGVLSLFVQLPGKPNLAIGSALVTLNDDANNICDDISSAKKQEKENTSTQNI